MSRVFACYSYKPEGREFEPRPTKSAETTRSER